MPQNNEKSNSAKSLAPSVLMGEGNFGAVGNHELDINATHYSTSLSI
jgi:hypothetical protein